jgi:hypothetical protein
MRVYVTGRYIKQIAEIRREIDRFPELGWQLTDNLADAEIAIFFDHNELSNEKTVARKVLVRQEPSLVFPKNYDSETVLKYDQIITLGIDPTVSADTLNWPQTLTVPRYSAEKNQNDNVIMINSNLLSLSEGECYSLRRECAQKLSMIHLYGYGWNNSIITRSKAVLREFKKHNRHLNTIKLSGLKYYFNNYKNYKGSIEFKSTALENYKCALVIENTLGYVSEKLFDSFGSGCIPVYVGPNLDHYGIPNNLFIQCEPNILNVAEGLQKVLRVDYEKWHLQLCDWISSKEVHSTWSKDTFLFRLKDMISN